MKNITLSLVACLLILNACTSTQKISKTNSKLNTLVGMMAGTYDSREQATADSTYYNISLQMHPIWEDRDGKWLYVEQALASNQAKPYRVRVYKIEQLAPNQFVSYIYTLKEQERFIGKWKTPAFFNDFSVNDLEEREGCGVYLTAKKDGTFEGSTKDKTCGSTLRGASYASSIVKIERGKLTSWDQGFDEAGEQVWGATKGGYIFVKTE